MTDHEHEATNYGAQLPRRQPLDTFAQHGAPPEPPIQPDGGRPWASPSTPPWGSLSQDVGHAEPRKRSGLRGWNPIAWVVVVLVALALCGFGALALAGAGGKAVVDSVNEQAADRKADVKITGCSVDGFGLVTVKYTIHNGSADAQSYVPEFNIESKTGTVYGQTADIVNSLAAGKDYEGRAVGSIDTAGGKIVVCTLTGA